jgi:hypothetical protein
MRANLMDLYLVNSFCVVKSEQRKTTRIEELSTYQIVQRLPSPNVEFAMTYKRIMEPAWKRTDWASRNIRECWISRISLVGG